MKRSCIFFEPLNRLSSLVAITALLVMTACTVLSGALLALAAPPETPGLSVIDGYKLHGKIRINYKTSSKFVKYCANGNGGPFTAEFELQVGVNPDSTWLQDYRQMATSQGFAGAYGLTYRLGGSATLSGACVGSFALSSTPAINSLSVQYKGGRWLISFKYSDSSLWDRVGFDASVAVDSQAINAATSAGAPNENSDGQILDAGQLCLSSAPTMACVFSIPVIGSQDPPGTSSAPVAGTNYLRACPDLGGMWQTAGLSPLTIMQRDCTISGTFTSPDGRFRHVVSGQVRSQITITRTDQSNCTTSLYATFTIAASGDLVYRVTGTAGRCGLPATYTEIRYWRRAAGSPR